MLADWPQPYPEPCFIILMPDELEVIIDRLRVGYRGDTA